MSVRRSSDALVEQMHAIASQITRRLVTTVTALNPLRIGFDISVLVVDGRAAGGSNLTQLADFAAMQLFARTKLQAGATQPAPTILTLLDDARTGRPAPASLTEWDLAYLRALYSYSDMYVAGAHRGDLAKRMTRFIRTDGDARAKQPD